MTFQGVLSVTDGKKEHILKGQTQSETRILVKIHVCT